MIPIGRHRGFGDWLFWFGLLVSGCAFSASPVAPLAEDRETLIIEPEPASVDAQKIADLRRFAAVNGFSQNIGLFADFRLRSGSKRYFIVDLAKETTLESGLIAHGHCRENAQEVRFSNVSGSNCSSEGKYRVGQSYFGSFGLAFKLHGLETTNSAALERFIVLHALSCIGDEIIEGELCESEGCPSLSPAMLQKTKELLDKETMPVLLWVYKSAAPEAVNADSEE